MRTLAWFQCGAVLLVLGACGGDDLSASGGTSPGGVGGQAGAEAGGAGAGGAAAGQGGSPAGGGAGMSGTSGQAGAAGSTPDGDCDQVYVSPKGNDDAPGCRSTPRKTIGKGLALVSTGRSEVRVCTGTYSEALVVDASVTIVGGFDCTSWASTLPEVGSFSLAKADDVLATRLVNGSQFIIGNIDPRSRAVLVKDNRQVTLRGLKITGHSEASATSWAVDAGAPGSTLTIDRCLLDAGGGQNKNPGGAGSIGLEVGATTSVTVSHSVIRGGTGVGDATGSAALAVNKGTGDAAHPVLVDHSLLEGGSGQAAGVEGKGAQGSAGLASLSPVTVKASVVRGGSGSVTYGLSSVAMVVAGQEGNPIPIAVSDSELDAGNGTTQPKAGVKSFAYSCGLLGVHVKGQVSNSRLYGGDPHAEISPLATDVLVPNAEAMHLGGGGDMVLTNNLLVGGNQVKPAHNGNGSARALVIDGQAQVSLLHNTLLGGSSTSKNTNPVALYVGPGSRVQRFENNLLGVSSVSSTVGNSYSIFLAGCPEGRFATFTGNAFLPAFEPLVSYDNGKVACASTKATTGAFFTFKEMTGLPLSATFKDNGVVQDSCSGAGGEGKCAVIPGCGFAKGSECQTVVFGSDVGLAQVDQPFAPLPALPCSLAKMVDRLSDVLNDARGVARTSQTTPGAIQAGDCNM